MRQGFLFFTYAMLCIIFFLYVVFRSTEIDGFGIKGWLIFDAVGIVTGLIILCTMIYIVVRGLT
jgi:hypothetical protein